MEAPDRLEHWPLKAFRSLGGIVEDAAAADREALSNQASAPLMHLELRNPGLLEFSGHFEEGGEEFGGGLGFEVVGAGPGFVAAEFEVAGGGHVAVVAVGEFDHEGFLQGAALFEFEAGFGEGFAGGCADEDVADAEGLDGEFGFGAGGGEGLDAGSIGEGDVGFALDAGCGGFGFFGPGEEFGVDGAPLDVEFAVAGGEGGVGGPGEVGEGAVDFGGNVVGDVAHLGVGGLAFARVFEVDVVDVAAGAVGHEGDEGGIFGAVWDEVF